MTLNKHRAITNDVLDWHLFNVKDDVLKAVALEIVGYDATKRDVNKSLSAACVRFGMKSN